MQDLEIANHLENVLLSCDGGNKIPDADINHSLCNIKEFYKSDIINPTKLDMNLKKYDVQLN